MLTSEDPRPTPTKGPNKSLSAKDQEQERKLSGKHLIPRKNCGPATYNQQSLSGDPFSGDNEALQIHNTPDSSPSLMGMR